MKLISEKNAMFIFIAITAIKMMGYLIFYYSGGEWWITPEDANLYDRIARGDLIADHPWGNFLKLLNGYGMYSRSMIAMLIFVMNCLLVPWLFGIVCFNVKGRMTALNWCVLSMVAIYPSMTIFSADIFRDTPMVVLFLLFSYSSRYFLSRRFHEWVLMEAIWHLIVLLLSSYLLYKLRFYLAAAILFTLIFVYFIEVSRNFWFYALLFLLGLLFADWLGVFDRLKGDYRRDFGVAGSVYGIDFSEGFFLLKFVQSFLYNIYGFYVYNYLSAAVFLVESIPMLVLSFCIYVNRQEGTRYASFFIVFFFVYGALWVIGVDALGTAVRYRIFNYLAIMMGASLIYDEVLSNASYNSRKISTNE